MTTGLFVSSKDRYAKYKCPQTGAELRLEGDALHSTRGGRVYPIKSGIPQFLALPAVEAPETREALRRLNQLAIAHGWRAALDTVYAANPGMIEYVTQPARAKFLDLLPLGPQKDVLEIGPGLGQFTVPLASRSRSLWALEVVSDQASFVSERARQERGDNIHVAVGGDDCRLPYGLGQFDVVVLNLVFEWCASRSTDEEVSEVQRRLLAEIYRVLKPGGSLYLATKNRFSLQNLVGNPDEHCYDIRFGSALPRAITNLLMSWRGHRRPLGMLYSHEALRRLLLNAGFRSTRSFWAAPEMRFAQHYVPTDPESIRKARLQAGFCQGERRSARLLMPLIPAAWVKHFTPGLAFLAEK